MKYNEIKGDLIKLALEGNFDVIVHGCNCFCRMGAGIAVPMAKNFGCNHFHLENEEYKGDINKLGSIVFKNFTVLKNGTGVVEYSNLWVGSKLTIVNAYTQYRTKDFTDKPPVDYEALRLCFRKMNHIFKGKHIGLPIIGCGLAGGIWDEEELDPNTLEAINFYETNHKDVKTIIQEEFTDCDITIVHFKS